MQIYIYIHNVGCTIKVNTKVKLNEEGVTIERVRLKRGFFSIFFFKGYSHREVNRVIVTTNSIRITFMAVKQIYIYPLELLSLFYIGFVSLSYTFTRQDFIRHEENLSNWFYLNARTLGFR